MILYTKNKYGYLEADYHFKLYGFDDPRFQEAEIKLYEPRRRFIKNLGMRTLSWAKNMYSDNEVALAYIRDNILNIILYV